MTCYREFHKVLPDYRMAIELKTADRTISHWPKPKPKSLAAKTGLRYENTVGKELALHVSRGNFTKLEHNPWFTFYDIYGIGNCSPDFLLWTRQGIIIVEVKLTWVEVALHKLNDLYLPVVSTALDAPVVPLVICRNLTREAPKATFSLREALSSQTKLLHWPANGHILW